MSRTTSFICKQCNESCWVGQSHFLYRYDYIAEFLHKHKGHDLVFDDCERLEQSHGEATDCISLSKGFVSSRDLGTCKTCNFHIQGKCKGKAQSEGVRLVREDFGCIYWEKKE